LSDALQRREFERAVRVCSVGDAAAAVLEQDRDVFDEQRHFEGDGVFGLVVNKL
jgi:hypothetical protein